jgi:hypothetical protein
VTAFVLLLGYGQYRRLVILNVCAELKGEGYYVEMPNAWHDKFFQRTPTIVRTGNYKGRETFHVRKRTKTGGYSVEHASDEEVIRLNELGMVDNQ